MISGQVTVEYISHGDFRIDIDDFSFKIDGKTAELLAEALDDQLYPSKTRSDLLTQIDELDTRVIELEDKIKYSGG